ncbi:hypothetical protein BDR07DRAFT_1498228 [Suillus spraguei]|nr:hypothetical protein BDR07DRAFT_1498228 [Suillus spraguei]
MTIPGSLIVTDSAVAKWNSTMQTAQDQIQNCSALQLEGILTTDEDKCWLTLMALWREQELEEIIKYVENSWRKLNEMKRLLGIRRNQ